MSGRVLWLNCADSVCTIGALTGQGLFSVDAAIASGGGIHPDTRKPPYPGTEFRAVCFFNQFLELRHSNMYITSCTIRKSKKNHFNAEISVNCEIKFEIFKYRLRNIHSLSMKAQETMQCSWQDATGSLLAFAVVGHFYSSSCPGVSFIENSSYTRGQAGNGNAPIANASVFKQI